ncbi:MAG TPA: sigma-54 dependent transcriptional regulator [Polyangia bacterium]
MASDRDTILVVDDAPDTVEVLERNLAAAGFEVLTAGGVVEAVSVLDARAVDVVVTDLKMPRVGGLELVRHVRENCADSAVVVITGYPSVEGAVEAIKAGADNFLPKPFTDEELLRSVRAALDGLRARRALEGRSGAPALKPGLIGASEAMRRVRRAIERCAATDSPVLVAGARGTGKELVARAIHYAGARAGGAFITADLAAIPPADAAREVLGPAGDASGGLAGAARGGTLYLAQLDRAAPDLQAGLARLLDAPAGPAGPRLIGATGEAPAALAKRPDLRGDLWRRLAAAAVELPPLRERGDDLLQLAAHFAAAAARGANRPVPRFSDRAIAALRSYAWPGNVDELQSVVEHLVLAGGTADVDATDLPALMRFSVLRDRAVLRPLCEVEREHIEHVISAVDGNRSRAAEILGIDRKTLREKLRRGPAGTGDDAE